MDGTSKQIRHVSHLISPKKRNELIVTASALVISQNSYYCSWSLEGSLQGVNKNFLVKYSYSWWKQSCTTWDVQNPVNNMINYQPQLVRRRFSKPSTGTDFTTSSFLKLVFVPRPLLEGWIQIPHQILLIKGAATCQRSPQDSMPEGATSEYLLDPRISDGICRWQRSGNLSKKSKRYSNIYT